MEPEPSDNINLPTDQADIQAQLDHLERHMQLLHRQIERLQRLAALGTMSATLAHEFNNLLTPIVSYCGYALSRDDPELLRTAVEKAHKNAQRLSTLCGKVLGLAVDDQMGPTNVELRPIVVETVECLGRDLEKDNVTLSIDVPSPLSARATPSSLQQVLFNLVINARQAMLDKGGALKIIAARLEDGRVEIRVADTGHGIKPDHIDHIFEPFFSTKQHESKPDRHGIGLGLHICKRLMEEQGGDITVASTPGRGTTFSLILPRAE